MRAIRLAFLILIIGVSQTIAQKPDNPKPADGSIISTTGVWLAWDVPDTLLANAHNLMWEFELYDLCFDGAPYCKKHFVRWGLISHGPIADEDGNLTYSTELCNEATDQGISCPPFISPDYGKIWYCDTPGFKRGHSYIWRVGLVTDFEIIWGDYWMFDVDSSAAPAAPRNLVVSQTSHTANALEWEPTFPETDKIDYYTIYRCENASNFIPITNTRELTYSDNEIQIGCSYDYVVTATDIAGVESDQSAKATFSTKVNTMATTPSDFALYQNYPNPFNPTTTIKFQLPSDEHVFVQIYNIKGETVSTLLNEKKATGQHSILFDASDLSAGIYIATIKAGIFSAQKRMLLLK